MNYFNLSLSYIFKLFVMEMEWLDFRRIFVFWKRRTGYWIVFLERERKKDLFLFNDVKFKCGRRIF